MTNPKRKCNGERWESKNQKRTTEWTKKNLQWQFCLCFWIIMWDRISTKRIERTQRVFKWEGGAKGHVSHISHEWRDRESFTEHMEKRISFGVHKMCI